MLKFHEIRAALRSLDLGLVPVMVHASLRRIGAILGGAETLLAALVQVFPGVMAPTFTYKTMVIPRLGPPRNGIDYLAEQRYNYRAEFFRIDLPADPLMGILPETLRRHPFARRTSHPILSFAAIHLDQALDAQTLEDPLAPIGVLAERGGWVLLLGVDHTVNTAIHYAERLAGRRQFLRWALTPQGVVACPGFPGCSMGFEAIRPRLEAWTRRVQLGNAYLEAVPLRPLIEAVREWLATDPLALLCDRADCLRCEAIRGDSV
ncbi:MAG: AAC(3) family N-acetyltransferase [Anaerolineales bacterium]